LLSTYGTQTGVRSVQVRCTSILCGLLLFSLHSSVVSLPCSLSLSLSLYGSGLRQSHSRPSRVSPPPGAAERKSVEKGVVTAASSVPNQSVHVTRMCSLSPLCLPASPFAAILPLVAHTVSSPSGAATERAECAPMCGGPRPDRQVHVCVHIQPSALYILCGLPASRALSVSVCLSVCQVCSHPAAPPQPCPLRQEATERAQRSRTRRMAANPTFLAIQRRIIKTPNASHSHRCWKKTRVDLIGSLHTHVHDPSPPIHPLTHRTLSRRTIHVERRLPLANYGIKSKRENRKNILPLRVLLYT